MREAGLKWLIAERRSAALVKWVVLRGDEVVSWLTVQAQTQAENWAGVLQEVSLPGTDASPQSFLHKAVEFCNKECWGTLSASIFVPPHVQKAHPEAVESAVADLQYGTVAVNAPSFVGFAVPQLAWGAYPGRQAHVSQQASACMPTSATAIIIIDCMSSRTLKSD